MRLTRRTLLAGVALWPVAGYANPLGPLGGTRAFSDAVRQIGGVPGVPQILLDAAESAFVAKYGHAARNAFADGIGDAPLDQILSRDAVVAEQAAFVAELIYTGQVPVDDQAADKSGPKPSVDYYPWALAWSSLGFAKAPGLCGGPAFGHWAHAPGEEGAS